MILQAPSSFLTALVALAGGSPPPGTLQIIESLPAGGNAPQELASNSQVAALINTSPRTFTLPSGFSASWIYIPDTWLEPLLGPFAWPQGVPLCLDANMCCDFQGAWGAQFLALGFTAGAPASGPWPILNI